MNDIGASSAQLIAEMRRMAAMASAEVPAAQQPGEAGPADFASMLESMVKQVNEVQTTSNQLSEGFAAGEPGVDLAEVMVAMQKARVHFETMLQVRNRLVRAYEEIMRMPV